MKTNWQRLKTLKEHRKADLNRLLRIASVLIILFSGYLTGFIIDDTEAWRMTLNLYRLSFLLLILTIDSKLKEIAVALLINHFIDRYFGINGWSWNDSITIIFIIFKAIKKWKVSN